MSEPTIQDKIEEAAKSPQSVSVDGQTVQGPDILKQIEADKYRAAKAARAKNHCGLTFRSLTPGGTG